MPQAFIFWEIPLGQPLHRHQQLRMDFSLLWGSPEARTESKL